MINLLQRALELRRLLQGSACLGAYAMAYALVGGNLNILPIQIGYDIEGDLNFDPGKASALSLVLAAFMAAGSAVSHSLTQRAQRWLPLPAARRAVAVISAVT